MKIGEILTLCDHTNLSVMATKEQILATVDDAIAYSTASVCIPPCYVKDAYEYACGRVKICTVIGFPNGYSKTEIKVAETVAAIKDGASEIDMVINIGMLKDGRYEDILNEINSIKAAAGDKILKVIIEACLLTDEEKERMCELVSNSGADYIKTSTGFSISGATHHDVEILCNNVKNGKKVKAAGGISSLEDAENFIRLGAQRLGTSRIVGIAKKSEQKSNY